MEKLDKLKEDIIHILKNGEARTCTYFSIELHKNYYKVQEAMNSLLREERVIKIGCIKERTYFKFVK